MILVFEPLTLSFRALNLREMTVQLVHAAIVQAMKTPGSRVVGTPPLSGEYTRMTQAYTPGKTARQSTPLKEHAYEPLPGGVARIRRRDAAQ